MSKEFDLTRQPQNTYSGSMPEPGSGEIQPPKAPEPHAVNPDTQQLLREIRQIPEDVLRRAVAELSVRHGLPTEEAQEAIEKRKSEIPTEARHLEPAVNMVNGPDPSPEDVDNALRSVGFTEDEISSATTDQKIGMLRAGNETSSQTRQGEGVWRNGEADQSVNVTGYLGVGSDGREYVSIEGSTTGVPLDEISFGGGQQPPRIPPTAEGSAGEYPGERSRPGGKEFSLINTERISDPKIASLIGLYNDLGKKTMLTQDDLTMIRNRVNERLAQIEEEYLAERQKIQTDVQLNPGQQVAALSSVKEISAGERSVIDEAIQIIDKTSNDMLSASETRRTDIRYRAAVLSKNSDDIMGFIAGIKEEDLTIEQKQVRDALRIQVEEMLEEAPSIETASFPSELLGAVRHFKELRERLINEILFKSYDDTTETGHYEINLYAGSNLDGLLGYMSKDDPEKYKEFLSLKTAANYFHTMNAALLTGNFDNFQRVAENINYQHFELMKKIPGVALVMRLYEKKYEEIMAKDTMISDAGYKEIKSEVERVFESMNDHRAVRSEYEDERSSLGRDETWKMEDWEIARALGVGRAFYALTYRATEKIAVGQVPTNRKRFAGFPFEDMVRVFNWNEWMIWRFRVAEGRHGIKFLENQLKRWRDLMKDKGNMLGINAIKQFGGVDVEKMENGGQYRTSGVYSGWRMENLAFDQIKLKAGDGTLTSISIKNFMDNPDFRAKSEEYANEYKEAKKIGDRRKIRHLQEEYADLFIGKMKDKSGRIIEDYPNLLESLDVGLSTFIKNGDSGGKGELGYILRQKVWERIAATNTPLMMDYLTGLEYRSDRPSGGKAQSLENILENGVSGWKTMSTEDRSGYLQNLRDKVLLNHEAMIARSMGDTNEMLIEPYTAEEGAIVALIKSEGRKLAPHLADIAFPYMPFMNDIPFDALDYGEPGQSFYKRRTKGDLGGFNSGQQGLFKIIDNAGGMHVDKALEAMREMINGIGGPEGDTAAQEAVYSIFEEYMDLITTTPGKRQVYKKTILEMLRMPTSRAQEWAGHHAQSIIEAEVGNVVATAMTEGVLNHELEERAKKRLGASLWNILWAIIRDVAPNVAMNFAYNAGSAVASGK